MTYYFSKIVVTVIALYTFYILNPLLIEREYSQEVEEAYSWLGYGGMIDIYGPIPYFLTIGTIAALVGTYFYKNSARKLLLWMYGFHIVLTPMWGIYVSGPFDGLLSTLINSGLLIVLVLSYTSLANRFE
ncbi:MAG: hypothetical protein AAF431_12420 [Pseudomonadota bacterium]